MKDTKTFQIELAELAIKASSASFITVGELSRLIAIYGNQKQIKNYWQETCENNGLAKATASDYWSIASFFSERLFESHKDARTSNAKGIALRLGSLGLKSLANGKAFKVAFNKVTDFSKALKEYRTQEEDEALEALIESCITKGKTLHELNEVIRNCEDFIQIEAKKGDSDEDEDEDFSQIEAKKGDSDEDEDEDFSQIEAKKGDSDEDEDEDEGLNAQNNNILFERMLDNLNLEKLCQILDKQSLENLLALRTHLNRVIKTRKNQVDAQDKEEVAA